jgi:hypothetical protein
LEEHGGHTAKANSHRPQGCRFASSALFVILLLPTAAALPVARVQVQREREAVLRRDLREMRQAINRYKDTPTAA